MTRRGPGIRGAARIAVRAVSILGVFAFAGGCKSAGRSLDEAFRPLAVGDTLPAVTLRSLDGTPIAIAPGQPLTLVNVWATWCTSCREEMGDLEALHQEFSPRGLRVVGVSIDQASTDRVRRFVAEEGLRFTIAHDPEQTIQRLYALVGVPETFLVGPDGRLLWRTMGNIHGSLGMLRPMLARATGSAIVDRRS
jgi:cytochrome c biogenesis protein CcmG, thiol:disulfide interchange protein DsbE